MALSVRVRLEVFKRDGFTCQYCGRGTPDVVLEVDHVVPRVQGGGDEFENLGDRAPTPDLVEQTRVLREREEQLRAYNDVRAEILARRNADYAEVRNHWFDVWGETSLHDWHMPWESALRNGVEKLGPAEVMEAMDITAGRFRHRVTANAVRYFGGILRAKLAESESRKAQDFAPLAPTSEAGQQPGPTGEVDEQVDDDRQARAAGELVQRVSDELGPL
jgi:hypothetical protein